MKQELRNHLAEQENRSVKDQKQELLKRLLDKDKEISHLKSHNQNLEEKRETKKMSNNHLIKEITI